MWSSLAGWDKKKIIIFIKKKIETKFGNNEREDWIKCKIFENKKKSFFIIFYPIFFTDTHTSSTHTQM